jgi:hypothetical protein
MGILESPAMAKGSADLARRSGNSRKPSRQFRNSERRSSGPIKLGSRQRRDEDGTRLLLRRSDDLGANDGVSRAGIQAQAQSSSTSFVFGWITCLPR